LARMTDDSQMRLLYVVNVSWFFISHRLPLAAEAISRGWKVHVATHIASEDDRQILESIGIEVHPLRIRRSGGLLQDIATAWNLWRLFKQVRPAISHHVTVKPVLIGGVLARLASVPAIVSAIPGLGYVFASTGTGARFKQSLILWCYRLALRGKGHRVIFQNNDDRALFLKHRVVSVGSTVLIRGAGVDVRVFHPTTEPQEPICVLMASRMLSEKGVWDFIAAGRLLRETGVAVRMVLAGAPDTGNPGSLTSAELAELQRRGDVEWVGHQADMPMMLAQAHIVCLPTYYGEGVPKILIEAGAAGRAIVATDVPGCREVVIDGETGILVPPRAPASLAAAIARLAADPRLRARLGANARSLIEKEFTLDSVVAKTFEVYDELQRSCEPGPP
jgi:glycosyltransferase involved in cell wall biosynthesis